MTRTYPELFKTYPNKSKDISKPTQKYPKLSKHIQTYSIKYNPTQTISFQNNKQSDWLLYHIFKIKIRL